MTDTWNNTAKRIVPGLTFLVMLATLAMVEAGCTNHHSGPFVRKNALWVGSNVTTGFYSEFTKLPHLGIEPDPTVFNLSPALLLPRGIIFDKSNNLWGTNCEGPTSDGSITKFTSDQLRHLFTVTNPDPNVFIQDQGDGVTLDCPKGLAFLKGNLYVASSGSTDGFPAIVEFSKDQLRVTGPSTPDPYTYFVPKTFNFGELGQLQFDKKDNLWVTDLNNRVVYGWKFSALDSIAGKGGSASSPLRLDPDFTVRWNAFNFLDGLAFSPSGNMWLTDHANNQLYAFTPDQIISNIPNQTPTIIINPVPITTPSGTTDSLVTPTWLSIQSNGYLWVTNSHSDNFGSVAGYDASQLKVSGSPIPEQFFDSNPTGGNFQHPVTLTFGLSIRQSF